MKLTNGNGFTTIYKAIVSIGIIIISAMLIQASTKDNSVAIDLATIKQQLVTVSGDVGTIKEQMRTVIKNDIIQNQKMTEYEKDIEELKRKK
jgi:cob(I)alamin adenosyltransferase